MGATRSGRITTLAIVDQAGTTGFVRFDTDGNRVATMPESHSLYDLYVDPTSERLYATGPKVDGPQNAEWDAYAFDSDGGGETLIDSCQQLECSVKVLAANSQGDRVVLHSTPVSGVESAIEAVVTPSDGSAWFVAAPFQVSGAALDPDRNVILVGTSAGGTFNGETLPAGPTIMKFAPDGTLLWIQQVSGTGSLESVGISAIGTVVALGALDSGGSIGGTSLSSGLMLVVVEADGSLRWAKNVPGAERAQKWLAVDPEGKAAVMVRTDCGFDVTFHNLAGDFLWSRSFTGKDCSTDWLLGKALAFSGHDLVLGGDYSGSVDFGTGTTSTSSGTSFLLKLSP